MYVNGVTVLEEPYTLEVFPVFKVNITFLHALPSTVLSSPANIQSLTALILNTPDVADPLPAQAQVATEPVRAGNPALTIVLGVVSALKYLPLRLGNVEEPK